MTEQQQKHASDSSLSRSSGLNNAERLWTTIQVLVSMLTAVNLGLTSWTLASIVNLREQTATIAANRYTNKEAKADGQRIGEQMLDVWQEISDIRTDLEKKVNREDVPSSETIRWIEQLDKRIDRVTDTP